MKLNAHPCGIIDADTWKEHRAPQKGYIQWADGRSAKELATYITRSLPNVPTELEELLIRFTDANAVLNWDAEYVTRLPGTGEGRNHDAVIYNSDIFMGVEAKADETLGRLISEEIEGASINKLGRIVSLMRMLFKDGFKEYGKLRYQLLTAATGTLIEAEDRGIKDAVLLVIVFKSKEHTKEESLVSNETDIQNFLAATSAVEDNGLYRIQTNTDINLFFKKVEIEL